MTDPDCFLSLVADAVARRRQAERLASECPGHERGGQGARCCDRAGEYNGFGSGPFLFVCPNHCSCHD